MTIYENNQVKRYVRTEFYNICPTHYFSIYDKSLHAHCLCFKITDTSYLNMKTLKYVELKKDEEIDMTVEIVDARVIWHYVEDNEC